MGRYIERLVDMAPLAPELVKALKNDIKTGNKDQFGVRNINLFLTKDGHGFCVVESPTVDALLASHNGRGIAIERKDVHEIVQMMADFAGTSQFTSKSK